MELTDRQVLALSSLADALATLGEPLKQVCRAPGCQRPAVLVFAAERLTLCSVHAKRHVSLVDRAYVEQGVAG